MEQQIKMESPNSNQNIFIRNRFYKSKSSGLSEAAIAIISLCIILILVIILISLIKSGKILNTKNKDKMFKNSSSIMKIII